VEVSTLANRIGLGCMRLSTARDRDEARGVDVVCAALDAGVVVVDTARAYAHDDHDLGHNERLIARAVARTPGAEGRVHVVTKGGMRRPGGAWRPDGRARSIAEDCAASRAALDGLPIDLYLLHAPDPSTSFATSLRALSRLLEAGAVRRVGLSNATRAQIDEARAMMPVSAVELPLGWFDDDTLTSGLVAHCVALGIEVLAHRPLGGEKKARRLDKDETLRAIADKHGASPVQVALAAVLDLHPSITVLPGPTSVAHAHACARGVVLDDEDRALLRLRLDPARAARPRAPSLRDEGEVVLVMGLQGSGKSGEAEALRARGYVRLNRDERGGTVRALHAELDAVLASGASRVVLDNTYLTSALRRDAIDVAWKHGLRVRGVWMETPLADAQVNVVQRMLAAHGRLLTPDEMAVGRDPTALAPRVLHRALRTLEMPQVDEGFVTLEVRPFARRSGSGIAARFIAADAREHCEDVDDDVPTFTFGWLREADAVCSHPAGPPVCWCRPPLPGLVLLLAARHGVDPGRSDVVGTGPAHRALAAAVGATYREVKR
jgi:aryl-alcohol dehydrogenase-like predicted oxidoreductase